MEYLWPIIVASFCGPELLHFKYQKKPFKPGHFYAKLSIKIDIPKCLKITVVMLVYIILAFLKINFAAEFPVVALYHNINGARWKPRPRPRPRPRLGRDYYSLDETKKIDFFVAEPCFTNEVKVFLKPILFTSIFAKMI